MKYSHVWHPSAGCQISFIGYALKLCAYDQNLREIADELTLGVDSFVFVDDNPAEREIVLAQLPGVTAPIMNSVENYITILDHSGYFEVTTLSTEDQKKTEMYHAKAKASKAVHAFASYEEYLDDLKMTAKIGYIKPIYIQRIAQVTNKTNQFNLTTLRCSQDDIKSMQEADDYVCLCGHLKDKFIDNGLVTVVIGQIKEDELHIKLWLMSCRVLKLGMEDSMMNVLFEEAKKRKLKQVIGYYYPTAKNGMVKEFYAEYGFNISADGDPNRWKMLVSQYKPKELHMRVVKNL